MAERVLITGVTGFLGGHLAEHLLEVGDALLGSSLDGTFDDVSPPTLRAQLPLVKWDLGHPAGLAEDARQQIADFAPTRIYHLAALSVPADCGADRPSERALEVNVEGTRRVLALAASLSSRPRVLLASSAHVYPQEEIAPDRPPRPVTEETLPAPRSAYGETKYLAERALLAMTARGTVHGVVTRSFQHAGPRQSMRMMLPDWCAQFARRDGSPVRVITRQAWVDLSDARDAVRAYRLALEHGRPGEVFNVGSGQPRLSGEVLELLRASAGPEREIIETRPGVRFNPVADVSRLRARSGWQPTIALAQTVTDTWAWWRDRAQREERG